MTSLLHIMQLILLSIFPTLVLFAAIYDFRHYRIPNWLNLTIFASFFPVALLLGMPWDVFLWHLVGFVTVFGALFLLYMIIPSSKFGGGDVKMLSAVAVWIDWQYLVDFGFMTVLVGGVLALVMLIWRALQIEYGVWVNGDTTLRKVMSYHIKIPYGAAIAVGGLHAYTLSWWQTLLTG